METILLRIGLGNALAATALAVVAGLVARKARRPALAHGLWLLVLLKLVTPPLATFDVDWPRRSVEASKPKIIEKQTVSEPIVPGPIEVADAPGIAVESPVVGATIPEPIPAVEPVIPPSPTSIGPIDRRPEVQIPPWSTIAAWIWLAGSIAWTVMAVARLVRFHRRLRIAESANEDVQGRADVLAGKLGLRRAPAVAMLPGAISPLLWAMGSRPRLLVPLELWARLDADQRDALLIHELAHLRRGDHWVRLLELVVGGLYWWFPVAWWARRALREAEEECCDAWVVWALPESNRSYASALLEAVEFLSEPRSAMPLPLGASGMGQFRHLSRRIAMIMKGSTPRRLSWVGLLGVLALAALLFPWVPSLLARQEPKPEAPTVDVVEADLVPRVVFEERAADGPLLPNPADGPFAVDPAKLEDARDEVELAEATVAVRKAAVDSAIGGNGDVKRAIDRLLWSEEMFKKHQMSRAQVDSDRRSLDKVGGADAAYQASLALREAEIRLRQAKRRLDRLEKPLAARVIGPDGQPLAGASGGSAMMALPPGWPGGMKMMAGPGAAPMPTMPGGMAGAAPRAKAKPKATETEDAEDILRLRRIGLALQNYHQAKGQFPPSAVVNAQGTPLLSWRVLILPFLDDPAAKGLFEQFHLDEPWDSPHNKPLAMKMPQVYATAPARFPGSADFTSYRALVGPGAGFEGTNGLEIRSFTDGTSNTLLVVRASTFVPWTMPNELAVDAAPQGGWDPLALKRDIDPKGDDFLALFADGSVRKLSASIHDPLLRAVITRNGGEVIDSNSLSPGPQRGQMTQPKPGGPATGMMGGAMPGMKRATKPQPAPSAGSDAEDVRRLKRIGLALHNYVASTPDSHFPPAAIASKDGKRLLSWRVAILPFLDDPTAKGLYEQFHLDEPWDSPHNKALAMKRMPDVYGTSADAAQGRGVYFTGQRAFVGPGAVFEANKGGTLAGITDGTSNTLLVARCSSMIFWTKPDGELLFEPGTFTPDPSTDNGPFLRNEIDPKGDDFLALFADGSVRNLPASISDSVFRALITRNGGEVISADALGPGPQRGQPTQPKPGGSAMKMGTGMGGGDPTMRRIAGLEAKMDQLLREMEAIRKERAPAEPGELVPAIPAPGGAEKP